jgi:hypothetical protein
MTHFENASQPHAEYIFGNPLSIPDCFGGLLRLGQDDIWCCKWSIHSPKLQSGS